MFHKSIATLILFIISLKMTYAANPITLVNSEATVQRAEEVLANIQPDEVLPLVLFGTVNTVNTTKPTYNLQVPENLEKVVTVDGKMILGTIFTSSTSSAQLFFCPKEHSDEACLVPKEFKESERLQCAKEPTPIVKQDTDESRCGFNEIGSSYSVSYEICPKEKPHKYVTTRVYFYGFCYDKENRKILFATYFINSPKLLQSNLLIRERNINYPFTFNEQFPTANYETLKNAVDSESNPSIIARRPKYTVKKLVPSTDMTLALWKKTLHQFSNIDLQHKDLAHLWDDIHFKVTEHAYQAFDDNIHYYVQTGVFDIFPVSEGDDQMYNMWVKMIVAIPIYDPIEFSKIVVILMNNFINDSELSKTRETKIESYCTEDLCADSLTNKFTAVKGRVRCCPMTEEIAELFGEKDFDFNNTLLLEIPEITSANTG